MQLASPNQSALAAVCDEAANHSPSAFGEAFKHAFQAGARSFGAPGTHYWCEYMQKEGGEFIAAVAATMHANKAVKSPECVARTMADTLVLHDMVRAARDKEICKHDAALARKLAFLQEFLTVSKNRLGEIRQAYIARAPIAA